MAWSESRVFRPYMRDTMQGVDLDIVNHTVRAALFNNSVTPSTNVANTSSAYNTGVWLVANEVADAPEWPVAGVALSGKVIDTSVSNTVYYTSSNPASSSGANLSNVYGVLVYDDTAATVANQGVCYNYLGGANSVTAGVLTIVWNSNGIFRITV